MDAGSLVYVGVSFARPAGSAVAALETAAAHIRRVDSALSQMEWRR